MNIFRTLALGKHTFREEFVTAFLAYLLSLRMDHGFIGNSMTNVRCESTHEKPSFRSALRYRRCLIPANVFFSRGPKGRANSPVSSAAGISRPWPWPSPGKP